METGAKWRGNGKCKLLLKNKVVLYSNGTPGPEFDGQRGGRPARPLRQNLLPSEERAVRQQRAVSPGRPRGLAQLRARSPRAGDGAQGAARTDCGDGARGETAVW